ncbi:MAG: Maf family protein [Candidatus Thermoplasmatota archaeon]|nr:Maf family protein [Candidatus Thermoplasmatota archaeon]
MRILLASASERRGAILRQRYANVEQAALKGVDESVPRQILSEQVKEVVSRKARAVVFKDEFDVFVVSDTLVEDPDDEQAALGKPASREQAVAMLLRLRGRRHRVWSATMVQAMGNWHSSVEHAVVEIEDFSDDALVELIESDSWVGKAGGYDLAGMMGKYAQLIEGTESTVLGFTQSSLDLLDDVQSLLSMSRS